MIHKDNFVITVMKTILLLFKTREKELSRFLDLQRLASLVLVKTSCSE